MQDNSVTKFENPTKGLVNDTLTIFLRESAQKMLKVAIEEEVNEFIGNYSAMNLPNGHKRVLRNGYLPEREIQSGIGNIKVSVPRIRDRNNNEISFTSNLIPQYMRRRKTIDVLLPILYLKGISTKDFSKSFKPIKKSLIIPPNWFMGEYLRNTHRWLTGFKSFGFHSDSDFSVSVGSLQADMSKPGAYDIDLHLGFK